MSTAHFSHTHPSPTDDDNDLALAALVGRAYLPGITADSVRAAVAAAPHRFYVASARCVAGFLYCYNLCCALWDLGMHAVCHCWREGVRMGFVTAHSPPRLAHMLPIAAGACLVQRKCCACWWLSRWSSRPRQAQRGRQERQEGRRRSSRVLPESSLAGAFGARALLRCLY